MRKAVILLITSKDKQLLIPNGINGIILHSNHRISFNGLVFKEKKILFNFQTGLSTNLQNVQ